MNRAALNGILIAKTLIDFHGAGRRSPNPGSLHIEHLQQLIVILVQQDGCAGSLFELGSSTHVVNVGVRHDDLLELQLVLVKKGKNAVNLVARIDNQSFPRTLIANDGAIAAKHANGKNLVNQRLTS